MSVSLRPGLKDPKGPLAGRKMPVRNLIVNPQNRADFPQAWRGLEGPFRTFACRRFQSVNHDLAWLRPDPRPEGRPGGLDPAPQLRRAVVRTLPEAFRGIDTDQIPDGVFRTCEIFQKTTSDMLDTLAGLLI